jgi:hypothetical protein
MSNELRSFLALTYDELEDLNLKAKEQRRSRVSIDKIREERLKYLTDEKRIKALTVLFSDLEGRLHMLDYDKKFLLKSFDDLPFADLPRSGRAIFAWVSTGRHFTGGRPMCLGRARCWFSAKSSTRTGPRTRRTFAAC